MKWRLQSVISIVTPGVNSRVCHCLVISGNLVFEIICSWEAEFGIYRSCCFIFEPVSLGTLVLTRDIVKLMVVMNYWLGYINCRNHFTICLCCRFFFWAAIIVSLHDSLFLIFSRLNVYLRSSWIHFRFFPVDRIYIRQVSRLLTCYNELTWTNRLSMRTVLKFFGVLGIAVGGSAVYGFRCSLGVEDLFLCTILFS